MPPIPPTQTCTLTPCEDSPAYCLGGTITKDLLCAVLGIVPCDPEGMVVKDALGCCYTVSDCGDGKGGSKTVDGLSLVDDCDDPECTTLGEPCTDCTSSQPAASVSASMTCAGGCGSTTSGVAAFVSFDSGTCTWTWETYDGGAQDPHRLLTISYDAVDDEWTVGVTIEVGDPLVLGSCYGTYYEVKPSGTFECVSGTITGTTTVTDDGFSGCTTGSATVTVG